MRVELFRLVEEFDETSAATELAEDQGSLEDDPEGTVAACVPGRRYGCSFGCCFLGQRSCWKRASYADGDAFDKASRPWRSDDPPRLRPVWMFAGAYGPDIGGMMRVSEPYLSPALAMMRTMSYLLCQRDGAVPDEALLAELHDERGRQL